MENQLKLWLEKLNSDKKLMGELFEKKAQYSNDENGLKLFLEEVFVKEAKKNGFDVSIEEALSYTPDSDMQKLTPEMLEDIAGGNMQQIFTTASAALMLLTSSPIDNTAPKNNAQTFESSSQSSITQVVDQKGGTSASDVLDQITNNTPSSTKAQHKNFTQRSNNLKNTTFENESKTQDNTISKHQSSFQKIKTFWQNLINSNQEASNQKNAKTIKTEKTSASTASKENAQTKTATTAEKSAQQKSIQTTAKKHTQVEKTQAKTATAKTSAQQETDQTTADTVETSTNQNVAQATATEEKTQTKIADTAETSAQQETTQTATTEEHDKAETPEAPPAPPAPSISKNIKNTKSNNSLAEELAKIKLKSVSQNQKTTNPHDDLMAQIRQGKKLKSVAENKAAQQSASTDNESSTDYDDVKELFEETRNETTNNDASATEDIAIKNAATEAIEQLNNYIKVAEQKYNEVHTEVEIFLKTLKEKMSDENIPPKPETRRTNVNDEQLYNVWEWIDYANNLIQDLRSTGQNELANELETKCNNLNETLNTYSSERSYSYILSDLAKPELPPRDISTNVKKDISNEETNSETEDQTSTQSAETPDAPPAPPAPNIQSQTSTHANLLEQIRARRTDTQNENDSTEKTTTDSTTQITAQTSTQTVTPDAPPAPPAPPAPILNTATSETKAISADELAKGRANLQATPKIEKHSTNSHDEMLKKITEGNRLRHFTDEELNKIQKTTEKLNNQKANLIDALVSRSMSAPPRLESDDKNNDTDDEWDALESQDKKEIAETIAAEKATAEAKATKAQNTKTQTPTDEDAAKGTPGENVNPNITAEPKIGENFMETIAHSLGAKFKTANPQNQSKNHENEDEDDYGYGDTNDDDDDDNNDDSWFDEL